MQGVDPDDPQAFVHVFLNLMGLIPWDALFWWSLLFIAVGALLGAWRGRLVEGIWLSALFGPLAWPVLLRPKRRGPPPLPRRRRR